MSIFYFFLFLYLSPIIFTYFLVCLILSLVKVGDKKIGKGEEIYITSDLIHSDYVFNSSQIKSLFPTDKKFVKVGWGDRKIFLETKTWSKLKLLDLICAFFGINSTVLRVEYLDELPLKSKKIQLDDRQIEVLMIHIKESFYGEPIKKKSSYYEKGDYYNSKLRYGCIKNCNNWVNHGLFMGRVTNRVWCPLSFLF